MQRSSPCTGKAAPGALSFCSTATSGACTPLTEPGATAPWPSVPDPSPATAEASWLRDRVTAALQRLPPAARMAVVLRHREDLSYAEIARHPDLPLGTVKTYLFRARRQLPPGDRLALEAHPGGCRRCRRELAQLKLTFWELEQPNAPAAAAGPEQEQPGTNRHRPPGGGRCTVSLPL